MSELEPAPAPESRTLQHETRWGSRPLWLSSANLNSACTHIMWNKETVSAANSGDGAWSINQKQLKFWVAGPTGEWPPLQKQDRADNVLFPLWQTQGADTLWRFTIGHSSVQLLVIIIFMTIQTKLPLAQNQDETYCLPGIYVSSVSMGPST